MKHLLKTVGLGLWALPACYGPHTITYVDSAREAGSQTYSQSIENNKVDLKRCPGGEVARIETYSSWGDLVVSYLTLSAADRSVELTCVKR